MIINFEAAINGHASWGVFVDCNQSTCGVPAAWNVNTPMKDGFFDSVRNYSFT